MRRLVLFALFATACASKRDAEVLQRLDAIATQQAELERQQETMLRQQEAIARDQMILSAQQREIVASFEGEAREDDARRIAAERELEKAREDQPVKPIAGKPDPTATYRVELGKAHVRGKATAKVTIVEFADFQCPFCARVQPTLAQLREIYGDDLRIAFKHNALPMHNRAMPAALAAEAAGKQGKFWQMHDRLFENTKSLDDESLRKMAKDLGLDVKRFERALEDADLRAKVDSDQLQGTMLGARGTPAFFINGRFLSGAQPVEAFRALIDEEMTRANAAVKRGVSKKKLYEHLIADGRTAP